MPDYKYVYSPPVKGPLLLNSLRGLFQPLMVLNEIVKEVHFKALKFDKFDKNNNRYRQLVYPFE